MREDLGTLRRVLLVGAITFATAAAGFTVAAAPALAVGTDRYVSTTGNDGDNDCTDAQHPCRHVDYAIGQSDANDTVHVAAGTYAEAEIEVDQNLTIEGASDGTTTVSESGEAIFGVFGSTSDEVPVVPTVTFKNLNISGDAVGLGILVEGADVHVVDSHVDHNGNGGIVAAQSTIEVSNSTLNDNGVAQQASPLDGMGLFVLAGAATVDHTTIDGNAGSGVVAYPSEFGLQSGRNLEAANDAPVSVKLDRSTVSDNTFGGVLGLLSSIEVTTSTLSGNTGAAVDNSGGIAVIQNSTLTNTKPVSEPARTGAAAPAPISGAGVVTINMTQPLISASKKNLAPVAGRLAKATPKSAAISPKMAKRIAAAAPSTDLHPGQTSVTGSIVADQAGVPDCQSSDTGALVDSGDNASSDAANSCGFSAAKHDLVKTDPKIGALADNGGPTMTHAPLKGSPVIDVIPAGRANCDADATDQRDLARVQPVAGKCDIGAVELAAKPLTIHPNSLPHGTVGKKYAQTITATGGQFPSYVFSLASGELPDGLTFNSSGHITGTPTKAGKFHFTVSVNDPVLKSYTIVIEAAADTNGNGNEPISDTGAHTASLVAVGAGAVFAGFLFLFGAGFIGRRPGRHRSRA